MVIPLMLATLTDRRDFGDDWLLERKFDGERCVARKAGERRATRVAHRQGSHRHLPRGPRCRGGSAVPGSPARRRGGGLRRRPDVLHPPPATSRGDRAVSRTGGQVPGRLLRLRPPGGRRGGSHQPAARRASRPADEDDPVGSALEHSEAWQDDSAAALRRGLPIRLGGAHREARRRAVCRSADRRTG